MYNLLKSMSDKMHQMGDSVSSSLGLDSKVSHEHTIEHNAIKKQELESKLLNVEPGRNMPSEVGIGQGYLQKEQYGVDSRLAACSSCNSSHAAGVSCSNARGSLKQVGPDQIPGQLLSHHTTERGTLIAGELHSQARMAGGVSEVQGQLHVPAHAAAGTVLVPEHQVGARVVVPEHEQRASVLVPAMQAPGQLDVAAHGVAANLNVHDLDARARVRVERQSAAADVLIPASATAAQVSLPEKVMSAPVQRPGLEAVTNVRVAPAVGRADMEFSGLTRDMALLSTGIDQQATVVMPEQNVQATLPGGGCATIHIPKTAQTARVHAEGVSMHAHVDVANQRTQATVMMPEHMQQAHISVAPATAQAQVLIPQHSQAGTVLVPEHHQRGQLVVGAHELEGRLHVQQHVGSAQVQVAPMATGVSVSLPAKAEQASVMVGRHEGMTKVDVGGTSDAVAVALPAIDEMEKLRVTTGDAKFDLEGKPIAETRTQSSVSRSAINP